MRWTVASSLCEVAPELPIALVPPSARARMLAVAERIPAADTRWIYLECRLARDAAQTDLIIRVAPTATTHHAITGHWLEFDCPTENRPVDTILASPGIFADLRPAIYAQASAPDCHAATVQVADSLGVDALSSQRTSVIERCMRALPPGAAIISIGSFPLRDKVTRRLCIAGLADDILPGYLERIGWPGVWQPIADRLIPLASLGARSGRSAALVHIDVNHTIAPNIAVELPFSRESQRTGRLAEGALLDALVAGGLCDRTKRDELFAWPRSVVATMPHELWPSVITRRLNHVKLVWRAGADLEAKAYLAVSHRSLTCAGTHVSIG